MLEEHRSLLYFIKLGMILQNGNCPLVIWKLKEKGNYNEMGSNLQDQIIFSSKQLWEGICLDYWMNKRGKLGIQYLSCKYTKDM